MTLIAADGSLTVCGGAVVDLPSVEIGHADFPGGTWGLAPDGHILGQVTPTAPGAIISSKAWIRRDVTGATTTDVRMAVYAASGGLPGALLGVSDVLTLSDANAPQNSWVEQEFTWSTPSNDLPRTGDVVLALHFGPTGASIQMGATTGGGGGLEYDSYDFASGAPDVLTGETARTVSFPLSATVQRIARQVPKVYFAARIDGQYYADVYGTDPMDPPWSEDPALPRPTAWDVFEQNVGHKVDAVNWGGLGSAWPPLNFDQTAGDLAWGRGAFSYYGNGFSQQGLADILANNQTAFDNLANMAWGMRLHDHPILYRPIWEMNGNWGYPWQSFNFTAEEYITIWRNLWQIVADVVNGFTAGSGLGTDTRNVSFFWCPSMTTQSVPSGAPWYPGDAYVDWVGWDGYAYGGAYLSPSEIYDDTYTMLAELAPSKPMGIGEFGVSSDIQTPGKAAWFADFFDNWLPTHPKVKLISYFNEYYPDAPGVFIEEPEEARAVFASRIANVRFSNTIDATTFPAGQKVPIPA